MWRFKNPVEIISGEDALSTLPRLVAGKRYSIVTYSGAIFAEYAQTVSDAIGYSPVSIFNDVEENPCFEHLTLLCERLGSQSQVPELFIALGGGSVMDTTKVLAASSGDFNIVAQFLNGEIEVEKLLCKPIIALPTTAGTGSEVTCWGTIWDPQNNTKLSLADERLYPLATLLYAPFTVKLPCAMTISSALDALSHALESLWNKNRNPVSSIFAITASKIIIDVLPQLILQPENLVLRTQMQEAALMAGLAFSNTKTSIAHNMSYSITLEKGVTHGIACSFTLPAIIRAVDHQDVDLLGYLNAIFGKPPAEAADMLTIFLHQLGVTTKPEDYGYELNKWNSLVMKASQGVRGQNFTGDIAQLLSQFK